MISSSINNSNNNSSNINNLNNINKIHFIGIGGISMSGLAELMLFKGIAVSGSDFHESSTTNRLIEKGAKVIIGHKASNITDDIDMVVYTAAISLDNEELAAALNKNINCITRGEFLGLIMKQYETAIGVSGTHGKTTTTSMISQILLAAKLDPTIMVGGNMPAISGNLRISNSNTFITESCEYKNSFLSFAPTIAVILNIAEDHMDFFKDIDDIRESFRKFAALLPNDGLLVINGDIDDVDYFTNAGEFNSITYGHSIDCDLRAQNIEYDKFARPSFDVIYKGEFLFRTTLGVTGEHNVYNALAAIGVSLNLNIDNETILKGLLAFGGTDRRFQVKGEYNGFTILDDYAHHPDEIITTLKTAAIYPHKDIWCIFQPHTYTRTKAFLNEFADALMLADKVILTDIYAAREINTIGISSKDIADIISSRGKECYYIPTFEEIEKFIKKSCSHGDLVITMGAGDVVNIGESLLQEVK